MNRLRTISWASSLVMAAIVGCQLTACSDDSDDTGNPAPGVDSGPDVTQHDANTTPDSPSTLPDSPTGKDSGPDATADGGHDAQADVTADVQADVTADVQADSGDAGVDAHADTGTDAPADVAADVTADVAADVMADVAADHVVVDSAVEAAVDSGVDAPVDSGVDAADSTTADSGPGDGGSDATGDSTVGGDSGGDATADGASADVADVSTADVGAPDSGDAGGETVQEACNAFLAANAGDAGQKLPADHATCTGTELALFLHDFAAPPATDSCLACALTSACVDTLGNRIPSSTRECEANTTNAADLPSTGATANTFYAGTTVAECVDEIMCGVGIINDPNCDASTLTTAAATACKTSSGTYQLGANGNAPSNLYCGSDDAPTCATVSAPAAPGSCVGPWLAGLPAADQAASATGGTAQADGAKKGYASGWANGIITCLFNNCESECLIQ